MHRAERGADDDGFHHHLPSGWLPGAELMGRLQTQPPPGRGVVSTPSAALARSTVGQEWQPLAASRISETFRGPVANSVRRNAAAASNFTGRRAGAVAL